MLKQFLQLPGFKMDVFKLTLVRHGETPENRLKIIQGHRDTVLSQKGAKQAELLGLRLENETFTHVYSSDLTRAQQTCEIVMKQNKNLSKVHIKTDVRLRERKLGVLEGQPMSSSKGLLRSDCKKQMSLGMETKQQLRQHAKSFFKELCSCLLQFQQRTSHTHRLTTFADHALSSDESKGACSFTSAIHGLPSTSAADNTDIFSETSRLSLAGESNVQSTERTLRNSSGNNNNSDVSNNAETCNSNDSGLPSDVPTSIERCVFDAGGATVAESDDYRGIIDANDGVNKAGNDQDMCNVVGGKDTADNSNVCQISGNELAEAAAGPSVLDDDGRPGNASEVRTECFDAESNSPTTYDIFASILVVSHGGLLMELLAYFVKELKCKLSDSQKARFRIIPNAGVSKFVVQIGDSAMKAFPKVVCLSVFETDHLIGEDVAPMVSVADLI